MSKKNIIAVAFVILVVAILIVPFMCYDTGWRKGREVGLVEHEIIPVSTTINNTALEEAGYIDKADDWSQLEEEKAKADIQNEILGTISYDILNNISSANVSIIYVENEKFDISVDLVTVDNVSISWWRIQGSGHRGRRL